MTDPAGYLDPDTTGVPWPVTPTWTAPEGAALRDVWVEA